MEGLIVFVALASAVAFFIGLIKPQWVRMPSRMGSSVIYGIIFICASTLGSALYPTEKKNSVAESESKVEAPKAPAAFEHEDLTLVEYRRKSQEGRHQIVSDYVQFKGIPASDGDGFYACLSEFSITKSEELPLGEVLGWCDAGYQKDPKSMAEYTNLDAFQKNFSGWDGSYRPLEKLIKKSMNDDSSYKHVETMSHLVLGKDPHAVVKTRFKGTNAYGGVVTQTVTARIDIKTGDVEKIIEE